MAETLYGFSEDGFRRVRKAVHDHFASSRRGSQRRRQSPVLSGGGSVKVIGPCAAYTPDGGDPDTDFETVYPGGCDGPDVLGVTILNITSPGSQIQRLEFESSGPLTLSTDTFSINCLSGSRSVYIKIVFNSLSIGGVVATIYNDSDDSILQEYTNTINSWDPLSGGNLQAATDNTACDCVTVPFNLCFSVPTR